jgi:hypothetical protein
VREHLAELVSRDLADIGGLAAERRNAGDGVPRRTSGRLFARPHDRVELLRRFGVDQVHRALGQVVLREQRVVRLSDDVHNGIADRRDIEPSRGHSESVLSVSMEWTIDERRLTD